MPTADVLHFPVRDDALARRGVALFSPADGSQPTHLSELYDLATGGTELETDPSQQLVLAFNHPRAVRVAAVNARMAQPPLGFALAVPVTTPQELANALLVNQCGPHVRDTLAHRCSWALLVATHGSVRQLGIGRALANRVLDGIRDAGAERVYLAARASDAWIGPRLHELAFSRDGVTRETHPRTLFSRDVNFSF